MKISQIIESVAQRQDFGAIVTCQKLARHFESKRLVSCFGRQSYIPVGKTRGAIAIGVMFSNVAFSKR